MWTFTQQIAVIADAEDNRQPISIAHQIARLFGDDLLEVEKELHDLVHVVDVAEVEPDPTENLELEEVFETFNAGE